jgi:hypothetical protein
MPPTSSNPSCQTPVGVHPLLRQVAVEGGAVTVRLLAYLCGIGMLAMIATDLVSPAAEEAQAPVAAVAANWTRASRPDRAFSVNSADFQEKTETYETFRHPDGGRKDILRWANDGGRPIAEIAVERIGASPAGSAGADLAPRMGLSGGAEPEPAGLVETKFGSVALWRVTQAAPACLGFARDFDAPRLRISGWSCAEKDRAAQQRLIGCALDRLILLSAGNNPELAALFARAELRRGACGTGQAAAADWVSDPALPKLRGRI